MINLEKDKIPARILVMGIGSFAAASIKCLADDGATVYGYLDREYGHYSPSQFGEIVLARDYPNPNVLIKKMNIDLVIPMSINWLTMDWADEFMNSGVPIFCPVRDAILLERDRDFAKLLCEQYGIPVAPAYVAKDQEDAYKYVKKQNKPFVIKNPLCRPGSPVHTIVCENVPDTLSWLKNVDYSEGVYLQEYMGRREVGHIAMVSNGKIYPMVTNQEYKRAFDGNMGPVAGAPLGGLIEADPNDRYGLVKDLITPLLPWFKETNFHGPVQATAVFRDNKWYVIEYNVRTGVTTGPALWRMLKNPVKTVMEVSQNQNTTIEFIKDKQFGCTLNLAGWGCPYTKIVGPYLTVSLKSNPTCDIWWNEVEQRDGDLFMSGHRIADVIATGSSMQQAIDVAYDNIEKIECLSSYYRLDIGKSLWPPGED